MIDFAKYDESGCILYCGQVPAALLDLQMQECRIYVGVVDAATQYIYKGKLCTYTATELQAKNNLPQGWTWKMPERFAIDQRIPAEAYTQEVQAILAERKVAYPPLSDLADALYWQSQGDNSKMVAYNAAVTGVKALYPKLTK